MPCPAATGLRMHVHVGSLHVQSPACGALWLQYSAVAALCLVANSAVLNCCTAALLLTSKFLVAAVWLAGAILIPFLAAVPPCRDLDGVFG